MGVKSGDEGVERRFVFALDAADWSAATTVALEGYGPEILGYLTAVVRNASDAADVFSMFAEHLWKGVPAFRRESSLRTWAYSVAWHAAMRFLDDPFRKRGRPLLTGELSKVAEAIRTNTAAHLRTAVKDEMARLRESLLPEEQTLLVLRIDRGMSWLEVGEIMNQRGTRLDEAALRKRFERLKAKLRQLAQEEGLIPAK